MKNNTYRFYTYFIVLIVAALFCVFWTSCGNPMDQFARDILRNYPNINVKAGTTDIGYEGEYSFVNTIADGNDGYASPYISFFIENTGTSSITISSLTVSLTDYDKTALMSSIIGPGETTSFDMRFDPLSTGAKNATVSIKSSKIGEEPYTFTVKSTGTPMPPRSVVINDFDACTNSTSVTLTIDGGDDPLPDDMTISNYADFAGATAEGYASTRVWTLLSGEGTKTVYIKFTVNSTPTTIYTDTITLDTSAPSAPSVPDLSSADDSGSSNTDNITRYTTNLTFTGTATANIGINLYVGGATLVGSGTADATGYYSVDAVLGAGTNQQITARAADCAGNTSSPSSALSVTVDTAPPAAPTGLDFAAADDTGTSSADNVTYLTSGLTFSGSAENGSTVYLYSSEEKGSLGNTASNGTWTLNVSLDQDVHTITVKATDVAGNASSESLGLVVTIDTTAPGAPSLLKPFQGENTGYDLTPTFTWTSVSGASRYKLQADNYPGFTSPEINETALPTTSFTPGSALTVSMSAPVGRRYYVRVAAIDLAGNSSAWSGAPARYVNVGRYNSDFNGDGYSDIIVGSSGSQNAYIFYGGASIDSTADVTMTSTADYFGRSVSSAGDLNGDGYCDAVVGAFGYDYTFIITYTDCGRAYIYLGGSPMNNVVDHTLTITTSGLYLGRSVASAGDMNGDGFSDLIVGAYGYNTYQGRAYIYLGASSLDSTADLVLEGETTYTYFGLSVSGAGDVNSDGYSDVIVGAYRYNTYQGRSYIFKGGSSLNSVADVVMTGPTTYTNFGVNVSGAGDVNNDGYGDVIVGASRYNSFKGAASVYLGGVSMDHTADAAMEGVAAGDYFGSSVSGAGDMNGDGYSDILVGAYGNDSSRGQAYLYLGASAINNVIDYTITGYAAGDYFGYNVGGGGDINGIGYDDIIIGALHYLTDYGRIYIFTGSSTINTGWDYNMIGANNEYFGYDIGKNF